MNNVTLTLNYQMAAGWLQPFVEGLVNGNAVAWCCAACLRTSYPPVRTCRCGQIAGKWTTLTGEAIVLHHTFGLDGQFAIVRFEGADTSTVVKLHSTQETLDAYSAQSSSALTGSLKALDSSTPELVLHIHPIDKLS